MMNYCPCCTDILLRHTNGNGVYWFCRTCWQSMPVSEYKKSDLLAEMSLSNLSQVINKLEKVTCLTESQKQNTTTSTKSDVHSTTLV
ncbi:hypothetical protein [Mastigocoleus sp. MO_188.B34]|uniref:hypothetical protein n=1 Tax=Mastigocoleus sp. MO_188.B34 TaxID=3036635 RepID=UPI002601DBFA|nr:hypothetical protein [Mastigocoleus sp. MO_188.B34]MDJ0696470.1 hypothetical protein [Mastigocoleus sp. MO_188.B34]